MPAPRATYRLQLGEDLGLQQAASLLERLDRLGISHLYLSPIWKARSGSLHGYDVVDPTSIDPRLGTRFDLEALSAEAKRRGMGIVCDVVPNHMAASHENPWWWDVLSRGPGSRYAALFDIDWDAGEGRVVLPVLGDENDEAEVAGSVRRYHGNVFPADDRYYRLRYWRHGEREINYRRFFDISELVATRMDDPALIDEMHALVFDLAHSGVIDGVRIDHIDGLRDPQGYLEMLRDRLPAGAYVVVEKILARDEELPSSWPCAGTTGYEFADRTEAGSVSAGGAADLRAAAAQITGSPDLDQILAEAKRHVIEQLFVSELASLSARFARLSGGSADAMRAALTELTVSLDVYRTYVREGGTTAPGDERIARALERVSDPDARDTLRTILLERPARGEHLEAIALWQQFCVPVTAKGVEDTAFYRDVALVSRNEVGGDPGRPSVPVSDVHAFLADRAGAWPAAMSSSSTHDSKRGEDVRARIDVLSEIPERWVAAVREWRSAHAALRDGDAPDAADEWLLYQTLVGTWPADRPPDERYVERIVAYMRKAAREAKRRSDWRDPDAGYEAALETFVRRVLADDRFRDSMEELGRYVALHGAVNSLARVVLKCAAPGVPDLYQGAEAWHLRLVDPDNREPVDHERLEARLQRLRAGHERDAMELVRGTVERWPDGTVKLLATWRALELRREQPEVFGSGGYVPLTASGTHRVSVFAFARTLEASWIVACVPRLSTEVADGQMPLGECWRDTTIALPDGAPATWCDAITGEIVEARSGRVDVAAALRSFPVSLLVGAARSDG